MGIIAYFSNEAISFNKMAEKGIKYILKSTGSYNSEESIYYNILASGEGWVLYELEK